MSRPEPPRTPRWVTLIWLALAAAALLTIIGLLLGGQHGPGRHVSAGTSAQATR